MISKLLIVDDDAQMIRDLLEETFADLSDFQVRAVTTTSEALSLARGEVFHVVLLDLTFEGEYGSSDDGIKALPELRKSLPDAEIVIYSNDDDRDTIAKTRSLGATSFLAKHHYSYSDIATKVRTALQRIVARRSAADDAVELAKAVGAVFVSKSMAQVFAQAANLRNNDQINVLITGPTGVGKEVVAEAIGKKPGKRYFAINCAALTDTLLESELFGHEKGAFTGASARKPGLFELADGGTLFLDEVGCLSRKAQETLLRVLQSGEFKRVNGTSNIRVKVRVICATNEVLEDMIKQDLFRADLYERMAVAKVKIPALAMRREDISPLVMHFIAKHGKPCLTIDPTCLDFLEQYHWPRNVRQLENNIKQMISQCAGNELEIADLPARFMDDAVQSDAAGYSASSVITLSKDASDQHFIFENSFGTPLDEILDRCAAAYIRETAQKLGPNASVRKLAAALRVPYTNLHRRLAKSASSVEEIKDEVVVE